MPGAEPGVAMAVATTWVFPVRRVEPVLAALREHGVAVTEVDAAVDPVRRAGAGGTLPDVERFPRRLDG